MGVHNISCSIDVPKQVEYKVVTTFVNNNDVVELFPSSTGEKRGMFDQDEQEDDIERISRFKSI